MFFNTFISKLNILNWKKKMYFSRTLVFYACCICLVLYLLINIDSMNILAFPLTYFLFLVVKIVGNKILNKFILCLNWDIFVVNASKNFEYVAEHVEQLNSMHEIKLFCGWTWN